MKWQAICEQICTIIPVKLRSFYFIFIHRALPCNYTLYKMCIVETEYCWHWHNVPETLVYMFCDWLYPQKPWNIIQQYLSISANKKFEVETDSEMLCTYDKENQIFTLISTVVKSYLFACKYAGKVPDPVECWNTILYYKDTEELIYLKHNKTTKFKARWHPLTKIWIPSIPHNGLEVTLIYKPFQWCF